MSSLEQLLGGPEIIGHAIRSEMDLHKLGRLGVTKKVLVTLAGNINMPLAAISRMLHVTERTLQRKEDEDRLNGAVTEQILQIAEVYARGSEVFDSTEDFQAWITTSNRSLGNQKPIDLLSSRYGAKMVIDALGRIEYGVFS